MNEIGVICGDGIGKEVILHALKVLDVFNLPFVYKFFDIDEDLRYPKIILYGATSSNLNANRKKSPVLTFRKKLGFYANLRFIKSLPKQSKVDIVIVREFSEDLYVQKERIYKDKIIAQKVISKKACKRIVNFAFKYVLENVRKKITCVHKSNVLLATDGLFRNIFFKISNKYPDITVDELYVDTCAYKLMTNPKSFDVIVTLNLYGDILSSCASVLAGGIGYIPSVSFSENHVLFSPIHGTAPDLCGKNSANPTGAILSAALMLKYIGYEKECKMIECAVWKIFSKGIYPMDIGTYKTTKFVDKLIYELKHKF